MYTIRYALVSVLFLFFGLSKVESQITDVDFLIQYNPETCLYEACIVIAGGSASAYPLRIQFNSQYTIVTPTGVDLTIDTLFWPKENNATYTGTIPCLWDFGPKVISPPIQPENDFHSVLPNLNPASAFNDLMTGDTVRLFGLSTNAPLSCEMAIRPFRNGIDPNSSEMPGGGNFNNGFTIGGPTQLYRMNLETIHPPFPEIDWDFTCNGDVTINVTPLDSFMCQHPYGYVWTGPSGSGFSSTDESPVIPAPVTPGLYEAFITDSYGCDTTIFVQVDGAPSVTTNTTICGAGNVTLEELSGSGMGTWTLDPSNTNGVSIGGTTNGTATATFDSNATGLYTFIYTGDGCDAVTEVTVAAATDVPPIADNGPLCEGDNLMLTTDFIPGATYAWTGPGFTSTDEDPIINNVTNANAGTYTLIVTSGGCPSSPATTTVVINDQPDTPTPSSNSPVCEEETITLFTDFVSGGTYLWSGPGGYSSTDQNPTISNAQLLDGGTYCVTVTVNGCASEQGCTDVIVNPKPDDPVANDNGPVCEGDDINLTTDFVAGASYSWSGPGGYSSTNQNPTISSATISDAGNYCVTVTIDGCESEPGCTMVVVESTPATPIANNNGPLCEEEDLNLTTDFVAGASYEWSGPGGFSSTDQNPTILGVTMADAGIYCVTVTENGCESQPGCTTVTINIKPSTPVANNNGPLCSEDDLELTTDFVAGASYAWSGPGGFSSTDQNPIISDVTSLDAGTYCVTVTIDGCDSEPGCTVVDINDTPATPSVSSNSELCEGETLMLDGPTIPGATYTWRDPNNFIFSFDEDPTIPNILVAEGGTYCLMVTVDGCDSQAGCTDVIVNPIPATPNVSSNSPICSGDTIFLYTDFVAGASYQWEGPTGIIFTDEDPIITGSAAIPGTYCLIVTLNGCDSEEACTDVVVNTTPSAPNISSNTPLCEGNDLMLSADFISGATYEWSGPNGFSSNDQNPIRTNITMADLGTYSLNVIVNGCSSPSISTDVNIFPSPDEPTPSSNSPICDGGDIELTVDEVPGANYIWSGPGFSSFQQNPTISGATITESGTYCVVISLNGCDSQPGCVDVIVNPIPATPTASNNGPICEGDDLELTTDAVTDATYAWTGPDGFSSTEQNPIIVGASPLASGSYCVVVTVNGCSSLPGCTDATVFPIPATPTASNNGPICEGDDLELTTDLITDATYAWTGPDGFTSTEQNPSITAATSAAGGTYCVVVTVDGCPSPQGCTDVIIKPTPATPVANSNGPICDGEDLELTTDAVTDATYAWTGPDGFTSTEQNPIITAATTAASGSYCVVVTVDDCPSLEGCIDVIVKPTPATPVANSNGPICEGDDLELTTDAVTDATYAWTGPDGFTSTEQNPIITAATTAASGSYCVVVTVDDCPSLEGCIDVIVKPTPATPVANSNGPICDGEDLELTTDAVTDATYAWTGPDGFTSTEQNPIITAATTAASGSYCVIVTVDDCPSLEGCIDVIVKPTPATPVANSNGPICEGEDLELTTDAVTDATYAWTGPDGFTSTEQNPIITAATTAASGSYCVVVTVDDCPSLEGCIDVIVKPTPVTPVANSNGPICDGEDLELTTDAVTDATYAWTGPDGFTSTEQNPIITAATTAANGSYCVVVTVDDCPSLEGCIDVIVKPTPATPVANSNGPICEGEDLELTTDAVTDATYAWTGPDGFTSTEQNPIITAATTAASGSYCVIVTVDDCPSLEGCIDVIIKPTPATPVANSNGPICEGEDLELTTDAVTDATYAWTGPDGFTSTEQNPIITAATTAASGSYCVIVTVDDCPSLEGCIDVIVKPTPATPVANSNGPICDGEDLELTTDAVTDATYAWTGPDGFTSTEQNPIITAATTAASGSYCVVVTVDDCPSLEGCIDVLVKPTPATPIANSNGPICEGEDLELTTPTVAGATYAWTGPDGFTSTEQNPIISAALPAASGNYCVIVTVADCPSLEGCVDVIVKPTPATPTANSNGPICEGDDLTLSTDAVAGATYAWTGPNGFSSTEQNPILSGTTILDNGNFCVRVTVDGCESAEDCIYVMIKPKPATPIIDNNGPICEGEDLNLTSNLFSGATYVWSGPNGFTSSLQNPIISAATPADNGTYCMHVVVNGCASEEVCTEVLVKPTPATPVASNNGPICENELLELFATTIPGATYTWSGPNGFSSNQQNPTISNASPLDNGSYCVYVTIDDCDSEMSCTDVEVKPTPPTPTASNNGPVCEDENLELYADDIAGATYTWSGPNGFSSNQQNPIIFGANPSESGTYCVFVTIDGCDSEVDCTDVIITPTPETPFASNNGPICEGEDLEFSATFILGATYTWSGPNGFSSNQQNPNIINASPSDNGTYCVFVTIDGCDSQMDCTDVIVKPTPPTPIVSNNGPICEDENIELTVENVPGATYTWSGPGGFSSNDQNPIITGANTSASGLYCVFVTVDGCISESACTDVLVKPTPPTPTVSNNGPICEDGDIELSASNIPGATYAWTGPNGFSSNQQNPTITGADPSDSGNYCVVVTVDDCVSEEACTDVTVKPTPSTPVASNNGPICEGEDLELSTGFVAGASYSWTGPNGFSSNDQDPSIAGASPAESGTYCVIVTIDGCVSESGCTEVIVKPTPSTPIANNNGPICEDEDIELSTDAVAGATYAWSGPNGFSSNDQNPIISNASPLDNGTYCVVITLDGCLSEPGCTDVIVKPTPATPVASNNGPICEGEDIELATNEVTGATYSWTGPNGFISNLQNPTITDATTAADGSYCVVITVDGCVSESGCTDVIVRPTPPTPTASNNGPICEDENIELTTDAVAGATYSWTGPNGFSSNEQNPIINQASTTDGGSYCLTIIIDGCESESGCTDVIVKPTPSAPIASNNGDICEGENLELSTGLVVGATYTWTGPDGFTSTDQNPIILDASPSDNGEYCVVVTVDGCESEEGCTNVTVLPTPSTPNPTNNGPICEGESLELTTDSETGATYAWTGPNGFNSTSQNPSIANASPSDNGSYCVVITIDGCESASACTDVTITPTPETPIASNNGSICEGENLELTSNDIAGATYAWSGPGGFTSTDQNPIITGATPADNGSYCVVVTVDGCESEQGCTDVEISPEISAGSDQSILCEVLSDIVVTMDATATNNGSWSTGVNPGSVTFGMQDSETTTITNFTEEGIYTFIWSNGICSDEVEITITAQPYAGEDQSVKCNLVGSATMAAEGNGIWTLGNVAGTVTFTDTDPNTVVTDFENPGTYEFIWTIGDCSDIVIIEVGDDCDCPIANNIIDGTPEDYCGESTARFIEGEEATPPGGTYLWQHSINSGPFMDIASTNSKDYTTEVLGLGTHEFRRIYSIDSPDCSDTSNYVILNVLQQPTAGADQNLVCQKLATLEIAMNGTGTGFWNQVSGPGSATIVFNNDPMTVVNVPTAGTYVFSFGDATCFDEVAISITEEADAGPDHSVDCFVTGSAIMAAVANANGSWSWGSTPGGDQPAFDMNDANATISGFAEPGNYELIWTVGDCSDSAIITVGAECDCPINNNNIDQPNPSEYCGVSEAIEIIGSAATPDGEYTWEYSFNSGAYSPASGVNDQQNYTTGNLPVGLHSFRRVYETTSEPICVDFSDVIEIEVLDQPNAGTDQMLECIELPGGSVTMNGSAVGTWHALTTNSGANIVNDNLPNTEINGFTSPGTYGFVLENGICSDTVFVFVTESVDAGPDQNVDCYVTGSATMAAVSANGTWSIGVIPATASSNPHIVSEGSGNTIVEDFDAPGTYELIWTVGDCSDIVEIVVGEDCDCPIAGNNIIQPVPSEFCDTSPAILIVGGDATPAEGIYQWEYSFNSGGFVPANGANDQRDYTTDMLGIGEHRFRRVFTLDTPPCDDVSNEIVITVIATPDAGADQTLACIELPGSTNMAASGTGVWTANTGNPSTVSIQMPDSPTTLIEGFSVAGDYFFTYTNGNCTDEVMITVSAAADAGADQTVTCFLTGTASLSATGTGTWSYGVTPNGDQPTFNMTNANTTISGFAGAGEYEVIWTSNGCTDSMIITVGDDCSCPIANNVINQPIPDVFCVESDDITIIGLDADPAGGNYVWEYSFNSGGFVPASGTADQRDYSTGILGVGEHVFRRIYNLDAPVCSDTSNVVTIIVLAQPDAGMDQTLSCVEIPATVTMAGTGPGVWTSAGNNPSSVNIAFDDVATTEISGLESGVYTFIFSNGICSDEVMITVTENAHAGDDQNFDCFETATAVMNASGSGTWSWGATPNGDQPTLSETNPNTVISGFGFEGEYNLTWTNSDGCTDDVVITVGSFCDCPIEDNIINQPDPNNFCGTSTAIVIAGEDALPVGGTYTWEYSFDNGAWIPANGTNNQRDYTTDLLAIGEHRYRRIYTVSDPIACDNISNIVFIIVSENANAGPDQAVECFENGEATMAAIGSGNWSWGTTPNGDQPTLDDVNPNATISGFGFAGDYELIWTTDDGCTDTATITVGDDCMCPIADNTITQPDPNEYCGESEVSLIIGSDATPVGGIYTWEYSFNSGGFVPANGVNDQKDYTTETLGVGEHRFRRIYSIDDPIDCDDVSNVVLIVVYEDADAGPDQSVDCFEDGIATMGANGSGTWTWGNTPNGDQPSLDDMNPNAVITGFGFAGDYELIWTTDDGCVDIVTIDVDNNCECPIENNTITQPDPNEFCGESEIITIIGSDALPANGSYTWEYSFNGGAYATASGTNDQRDYTTDVLVVGEHRYRRIYSVDDPIECDNLSNVVLIIVHEKANAGLDQDVDCFEDGSATMGATGSGTWSWGTTPGGDQPTLDDSNPNAVISGFASDGEYILIWTTDDGCTDEVSIIVGVDCNCPIENNTITQPDPNEFCGESEILTILGSDATPAGGTYTWEYSFNSGAFAPASGTNDQRDYTTDVLGVGEHRFRRTYSIDSPIECDDVSNVVLIAVYENADAGLDLSVDCFEDGIATVAASGSGTWTWGTTPNGDQPTLDSSNPNAEITGFGFAGEYELIWTTDDGCIDMITIAVGNNCNCPITDNEITQPDPNEFCGESDVLTILGSDALPAGGDYIWEYSFNSGGFVAANGTNDQRDYTTDVLGVGEHRFRRIYAIDSPMECDDVSNEVVVIVYENADAGPDQTVDCFEDGEATMAATGVGEWTWSSSLTATISPADSPNALINGFPEAGTYELIWTSEDGCSDLVTIEVGDNCNCSIAENNITQPDPNEFCGESNAVTILGSDAMPAGGTYRWEYSFNSGAFASANGAFDQRDYTTELLPAGEHRFRRVYAITDPMDCSDVSNEVLIIVYENANAGADQDVVCFEDGEATITASGEGEWTWSSVLEASIDDFESATAIVNGFPEAGTYELTWTTDDGCTDQVLIQVGDDCFECAIMNNDISQPIPSDYCNESPEMTIVGGNALPSNGVYTWEYSFNGSPFTSAIGDINQPSYNTADLGPGEHRFRRRYRIQTNPLCEDVSDIVVINVLGPIEAGESQDLGCTNLEEAIANMAAIGEGTWSQSTSNPSPVIFSDENDSNAVISGFGEAGMYTFIWSNDMCQDEMTVLIEETKNAGDDQVIECYIDGSATLNAEGIGIWSMGSNNPGTVEFSSLSDPNAILTNFSANGIYEFIWTVNGCDDIVLVDVGDSCPCLVEFNEVIDDVSNIFCKTTGDLFITGEEALPVGGTYLWQISIKGSGFSDAPGVNNTKDYDASNFGEGTYILRRQYTFVVDGIECSDISNEIDFFVFDKKQNPGQITFSPDPVCLGDSLVLEVDFNPELTYDWQVMSGNGRVVYALDSMSMIVVDSPGKITVSVTQYLDGCDGNLASSESEIDITVLDTPKPNLGPDTTFCELDETFTVYPGEFAEYEWHDGSTDDEFLIDGQGIYRVSVMDTMGCVGTDMVNIKSFCCEFAYPNIFKADSRGGNDIFKVTDIYNCVIEAEMFIYDRWGNLVYVGDGLESWDGTFNGKFVEQGVYVFIYKYKAMDADRLEFEDEISGDVTVIR